MIFESSELVAIGRSESDCRFDPVLPPSIEKEPFLWREAEITFLPVAVFEDA
jgi:hypothetical protein